MSDDPRVEELARAHHKASRHCALDAPHSWDYAWARSVWDAEADLRERISGAIREAAEGQAKRVGTDPDPVFDGWYDGMLYAAQIAERQA